MIWGLKVFFRSLYKGLLIVKGALGEIWKHFSPLWLSTCVPSHGGKIDQGESAPTPVSASCFTIIGSD